MRPLSDRIALIPDAAETITKSGIIIPDKYTKAHETATVSKLGPAVTAHLKEGDKVMYTKNSGTEAEIDGITYLFIKQRDVLGVFEN